MCNRTNLWHKNLKIDTSMQKTGRCRQVCPPDASYSLSTFIYHFANK